MAITYRGGNAPTATQSPVAPVTDNAFFRWNVATTTGNLNIGYVLCKPSFTVPTAPPGWQMLDYVRAGSVGPGPDSGSLSLALFYKMRTSSESNAYPHFTAEYAPVLFGDYAYAKGTSSSTPWNVSATYGADTSTDTNSFSATCSKTLAFRTADEGLVIIGMTSDDIPGTDLINPALAIPGCTISAMTILANAVTPLGNALRIAIWRFTVTGGTATGAPAFTGDVTNAAYAAGPLAVVRIAEVNGPVLNVVQGTVSVAAQAAIASVPDAILLPVAVDSPVGEVNINPANPPIVLVESPPGTVGTAQQLGDVDSGVGVIVATSAVLLALNPLSASAQDELRPAEVQVWDPNNGKMVIVADGRMNLQWQDDLNQPGSGSFSLHHSDPKATSENLRLFSIVKIIYAGNTKYAFRIDSREIDVVGSADHESQVWKIKGRGALSLLGDAVLYPEYAINSETTNKRKFFFGSKEGPWYVASEWVQPQGMPLSSVPDDHPWKGLPAGWPDPDAQWIWPGVMNAPNDAETAWFRTYFTLSSPQQVVVYTSADDSAMVYLNGYYIGSGGAAGSQSFNTTAPSILVNLPAGTHLLAIEATNSAASIPEVQPITNSQTAAITFSYSGNMPYIGRGFTDGGNPYVDSDGSVQNGGPGSAVFDGNDSTYWLSVGNYKGWSSAYEYVEGTFARQTVTAVRVKARGGPYTIYVSLKDGGNAWNGSQTVPYIHRVVDAGTNIRYVKSQRVDMDADVVIDIPAQMADRVRVTLSAEWDSGIWQYRWRAAMYTIAVTGETREGKYIRGGNFSGLLVTVATQDDTKNISGIVHRSQPEGWLAHTGERPGWRTPHILMAMIEEAKLRNVLGPLMLSVGFTATTDSNNNAWTLPRKEYTYDVGINYLDLLDKLIGDSTMDVWIDYDTMMIHAAEVRGRDRSPEVLFRPGQSVLTLGIDNQIPGATRFMVEATEFGALVEVGSFIGEVTYGRIEKKLDLNDALSVPEAIASANTQLEKFALESYDMTTTHTDLIGPRPYVDYDVGDYVLLPKGFGDSSMVLYRIISITINEAEAGELQIRISSDLAELENDEDEES